MFTKVKTPQEIDAMREGGKMLATVLRTLARKTMPGASPKDMSILAAKELQALGGEAAFKDYEGDPNVIAYPDIICISVNNQVQHSIPTAQLFKEGDVVNYDFGVRHRGLITDGGVSVGVGKTSPEANRLLNGTEQALEAGIAAVIGGCRVGDISAAIETVIHRYKLGIVEALAGHGVGHYLHEDPTIPNSGERGRGPVLQPGMTIAIEPITTLGSGDIAVEKDGWTLITVDGSWSAQFEHTILVTETGSEILTTI